MAMRAGFNLHHSDLQEFLSAPVWDEKSGTPLSILSAMARLGMDPWGEAARLAEMPRAGAAAALAAILPGCPGASRSYPTTSVFRNVWFSSCRKAAPGPRPMRKGPAARMPPVA